MSATIRLEMGTVRNRPARFAVAPISLALAIAFAAPALAAGPPGAEEEEPGARPFYVPREQAPAERAAFREALEKQRGAPRALYEAYLDRIGANGVLDALESLSPTCHDEAHDLGKAIQARLGNIGDSLRACDRRCHSGCMHGVLMEAFRSICTVDGRVKLELLAPSVELVCLAEQEMRASYSIGDCAHGVGHAVMFLSEYSIDGALGACGGFRDERMRYYCATGAYMEFVTSGHADETIRQGLFEPCRSHPYPAACARYLMPRLLRAELARSSSAKPLFELCRSQVGAVRLGCVHGLANAMMPWLSAGRVRLAEVCPPASPDEERVCIEGAVERLARYKPQRATEACAELEGARRSICDEAARNQMYNMDKDLSLYLHEAQPAPKAEPVE